jgi:hypothetical protein
MQKGTLIQLSTPQQHWELEIKSEIGKQREEEQDEDVPPLAVDCSANRMERRRIR